MACQSTWHHQTGNMQPSMLQLCPVAKVLLTSFFICKANTRACSIGVQTCSHRLCCLQGSYLDEGVCVTCPVGSTTANGTGNVGKESCNRCVPGFGECLWHCAFYSLQLSLLAAGPQAVWLHQLQMALLHTRTVRSGINVDLGSVPAVHNEHS